MDAVSTSFLPSSPQAHPDWLRQQIRPVGFEEVQLPEVPAPLAVSLVAYATRAWCGTRLAVVVTGSVCSAEVHDDEDDDAVDDLEAPHVADPARHAATYADVLEDSRWERGSGGAPVLPNAFAGTTAAAAFASTSGRRPSSTNPLSGFDSSSGTPSSAASTTASSSHHDLLGLFDAPPTASTAPPSTAGFALGAPPIPGPKRRRDSAAGQFHAHAPSALLQGLSGRPSKAGGGALRTWRVRVEVRCDRQSVLASLTSTFDSWFHDLTNGQLHVVRHFGKADVVGVGASVGGGGEHWGTVATVGLLNFLGVHAGGGGASGGDGGGGSTTPAPPAAAAVAGGSGHFGFDAGKPSGALLQFSSLPPQDTTSAYASYPASALSVPSLPSSFSDPFSALMSAPAATPSTTSSLFHSHGGVAAPSSGTVGDTVGSPHSISDMLQVRHSQPFDPFG